jgi:UDP-N-acetylglucosamine 1-carboxyvinyltransferase
MGKILIRGGRALHGEIAIGGAKNAALPLIAAGLLSNGLTLNNVPMLSDVVSMCDLMRQHGINVTYSKARKQLTLSGAASNFEAPYDLVRKMRASVLVLGPLLTRYGQAKVSLPGGCAIGSRPVDLHLDGLSLMGATINLENGYVLASCPRGLVGAKIHFSKVSVGATENLMMAAALAKGETELSNAAQEPEIKDLASCLTAMGAKIEGAGTSTIRIQGVPELQAARHEVLVDRIEAGTYACAAAITNGDVVLRGASLDNLGAISKSLRSAGVHLSDVDGGVRVYVESTLQGTDVMTEPFPGFATDMQAQFMALMCRANGASMITETIFENRFMHVPELLRMGARINYHGSSAIVRGVDRLRGAQVMATDLRASFSLVIAALAAEGNTVIDRIYHIDRGYEDVCQKLSDVGADIERVSASEKAPKTEAPLLHIAA